MNILKLFYNGLATWFAKRSNMIFKLLFVAWMVLSAIHLIIIHTKDVVWITAHADWVSVPYFIAGLLVCVTWIFVSISTLFTFRQKSSLAKNAIALFLSCGGLAFLPLIVMIQVGNLAGGVDYLRNIEPLRENTLAIGLVLTAHDEQRDRLKSPLKIDRFLIWSKSALDSACRKSIDRLVRQKQSLEQLYGFEAPRTFIFIDYIVMKKGRAGFMTGNRFINVSEKSCPTKKVDSDNDKMAGNLTLQHEFVHVMNKEFESQYLVDRMPHFVHELLAESFKYHQEGFELDCTGSSLKPWTLSLVRSMSWMRKKNKTMDDIIAFNGDVEFFIRLYEILAFAGCKLATTYPFDQIMDFAGDASELGVKTAFKETFGLTLEEFFEADRVEEFDRILQEIISRDRNLKKSVEDEKS